MDDSVAVLGVGPCAELRARAESLGGRGGRTLQLWIGGRLRRLRALGAEGIVGYLVYQGDLFVLGHLGGDEFGLACQSGEDQRGLRKYTLEEVMHGDLGRVIERVDPQTTSPARKTSAGRGQRPGATSRPAPAPAPEPARLRGLDLLDALVHLTPRKPWIGVASTVIPLILDGLRGLVQLGLDNEILWSDGLLDFIALHTGLRIFCCSKILNAALRIIARRTRLLVRRGRRWLLRLGDLRVKDSRLLQWMKWRGPLDVSLTARSGTRHDQRDEPVQAPEADHAVPDTKPAAGPSPPTSSASTKAAPPTSSAPAHHESLSVPTHDEPTVTCETASPAADVPSPAPAPAPRAAASEQPPPPPAPPEGPPCAADEWACDPRGGLMTGSADGWVLAMDAPIDQMTPPPANPGSRQPPWRSPPSYDPGVQPPWLSSFEAFQAMYKDMLGRGARRPGRGPGVTSRRHPPWVDYDDFDLADSSRERRHRPP